jgi:hypothetical protein
VTRADLTQALVPLSFQRWRDVYGFAPYQSTRTEIVRYPWASTLYAVTDGGRPGDFTVERLTFAQWQYAGFPAPEVRDWVRGSTLRRYGTSTQIFLTAPAGGASHALTYAEWEALRFERFEMRSNEGFVRLSWDTGIVHMTDLAASHGTLLTFADWALLGFPTPRVVDRVPGDHVFRFFGSSKVYYQGATMTIRPVTYSQWQQMGFPAPEVRGAPPVPADKSCTDYPNRFAAQMDFRLWQSEGYGDLFGLDADHDGIACEDYFSR